MANLTTPDEMSGFWSDLEANERYVELDFAELEGTILAPETDEEKRQFDQSWNSMVEQYNNELVLWMAAYNDAENHQ